MVKPTISKKKISELIGAPYNPREISSEALAGLTESVARYSLVEPPVFNVRTGNLVSGHQRIKAAKAAGFKAEDEIDVVVIDISEDEEKALNLTLNNPAIQGQFVTASVDALLSSIRDELPGLIGILQLEKLGSETTAAADSIAAASSGEPYDGPDDLDRLGDEVRERRPDVIPEIDEEKPAITQPGDLWLLGNHRLLCGDSSVPADVEILFSGRKGDLMVTSPPYFNQRAYAQWPTFEDYLVTMQAVLDCTAANMEETCVLCWNVGDDVVGGHDIPAESSILMRNSKFRYRDKIAWVKDVAGYANSSRHGHIENTQHYFPAFQWEPILIFINKNGKTHPFDERDTAAVAEYRTNVWNIAHLREQSQKALGHIAAFPLELPLRLIRCYSQRECIVYDPFCGSGTTLIAAEMLGRTCYACEISPIYCDAIVERWKQKTGIPEAVRIRADER